MDVWATVGLLPYSRFPRSTGPELMMISTRALRTLGKLDIERALRQHVTQEWDGACDSQSPTHEVVVRRAGNHSISVHYSFGRKFYVITGVPKRLPVVLLEGEY